jgi:phosphohistidine phosphatase SixA
MKPANPAPESRSSFPPSARRSTLRPPLRLESPPRRLLLALLPRAVLVAAALLTGTAALAASSPEEERFVQALRQAGVVILIRHAATDPGVGDPPGFKLDDCATQRNLSDTGRAQARRLGQWFKTQRIEPTSVRVSPWCRTRETAMLAFGRAQDWTPLSNLLGDRSPQEQHAMQVRAAIAGVGRDGIEVMVSHGVSISAFIDIYLQQGEMVAVRPAAMADGGGSRPAVEVVGRLLIP